MMDITAIGEVLIDLTQTGVNEQKVPLFAANPGGAPANVAVAAARLGANTAFIGKVGQDGFGAYLTRVLTENQVDVSGLRTDDAATTMAVVAVSDTGERSFRFVRGADCNLKPEEVDTGLIAGSKVLHFGSVSLTAGPAREATLFAAQRAREAGVLVSYDPNYRDALWNSQAEAVEWMKKPLPLVDVLKLSDEELPLITGTDDPEEGTHRLEAEGTTVADTNGAGDTFLGAVLSRLVSRGEKPLEGLTAPELEAILAFANRAASKTCSRSGAIPAMPTMAELEEGDNAHEA